MLHRTLISVGSTLCRILLASIGFACTPAIAQVPSLSLSQALSRAAASDAVLPAAHARIAGARAGINQAGRRPNPVAGVDVENFSGSGNYRGTRGAETTAYLQQIIELGGKREARIGVATSELSATQARGAALVLDVMRDVEIAWITAASATATLDLAKQRLAAAQSLQEEVARRAQAGRDPSYVQTRTEAQVTLERISVEQAESALEIALVNLAAYWRGKPQFAINLAEFEKITTMTAGSRYEAERAIVEAERALANARVDLERARAVPDPAVRLGVRRFSDTSDTAVIAGLAIPIPIFDQNKDAIARAQAQRRAAELDVETVQRTLRRELARLRGRLKADAKEARRVQNEAIPQAERAVALIRDGLVQGAFTYVEFNDAQRLLNDARARRVEALRAYHTDVAAIARLTGLRSNFIGVKGNR